MNLVPFQTVRVASSNCRTSTGSSVVASGRIVGEILDAIDFGSVFGKASFSFGGRGGPGHHKFRPLDH